MKDNTREDFLDVNEIFFSIDGEGKRTGELATFLRLNYCNERCSYCDTLYALDHGDNFLDFSKIRDELSKYPTKNLTITGGEPLSQENLFEFMKTISEYNINIETNGSIDIEKFRLDNVFFTMDIKTPSSNMERFNNYDNLNKLNERDVLKFVIGSVEDLEFSKDIIEKFKPNAIIYFSPVFGFEPYKIVDFMKDNNMENVRLGLQIHKFIWDPEIRGV